MADECGVPVGGVTATDFVASLGYRAKIWRLLLWRVSDSRRGYGSEKRGKDRGR